MHTLLASHLCSCDVHSHQLGCAVNVLAWIRNGTYRWCVHRRWRGQPPWQHPGCRWSTCSSSNDNSANNSVSNSEVTVHMRQYYLLTWLGSEPKHHT